MNWVGLRSSRTSLSYAGFVHLTPELESCQTRFRRADFVAMQDAARSKRRQTARAIARVPPATADRKTESLVDQIDQRLAGQTAPQVLAKEIGHLIDPPAALSADVRRDDRRWADPTVGWSCGSGSTSVTSSPPPPSCPLATPRPDRASTTSGPRATLISIAPGFILAESLARRSSRVCDRRQRHGQEQKVDLASRSSSRSAGQALRPRRACRPGNRSAARIRVLNALSTSASRRPLPPKPTMPTVLWCRSRGGPANELAACWARKTPAGCGSAPRPAPGHVRPPGRPARPRRW